MKAWLLVVSLLAGLGVGCVPGEYHYAYAVTAYPPAPQGEIVGVAPDPSWVWVGGYWWWDGQDYVWVRGYWAPPPSPGYVWVRSGWVVRGDRYVFVRGYWAAPRATPRYRYVHPAPRVRVRPGVRYRAVPPPRARPRARPRVRVR